MSELLSYLLAQARRQPIGTLRFAAGEAWRRGRLRFVDSVATALPQFAEAPVAERFAPFLPDGARESTDRLRKLRFAPALIEAADRIRRHEFMIFGERVSLGPALDWHRDWKSGYRWQLDAPARLNVLGAPPGADVKRPWELGRFHHALALGQAFLLTRDAAYFREFVAQVEHWIEENPYPRGIHWAVPMEVAIRAINWVTAAALFAAAGGLDPHLAGALSGSLFLHGRHLYTHREWNPVARANHYLACVLGLLHLGALFRETREGSVWFRFARRELLSEMENQVSEDGAAREGSSAYHAFVAEMFLTGGLLLARLDAGHDGTRHEWLAAIEKSCGTLFARRLARMLEFLAALGEGRERPPVWGDADDGRLLPFSPGDGCALDEFARASRLLLRSPCSPGSDGATAAAEVFWRLGELPSLTSPAAADRRSWKFPAAGFFFFSSRRLQGSVRCGPLGVSGWSNHAHCDQLSFEFCCDGQPVLIDPGLPCYAEDREARNLFRSTRYHNVVTVAGAEQNRFWPGLLFRILDDTRSRLLRWQAGPEGVEFAGEHSGYMRLPEKAMVRRELNLDASRHFLSVRDAVDLRGSALLEWFFHLAPGLTPAQLELSALPAPAVPLPARDLHWHSAWRVGPIELRVWTSLESRRLQARVEDGWFAPRFGKRLPAPILSFRGEASGAARALFEFCPRADTRTNVEPRP